MLDRVSEFQSGRFTACTKRMELNQIAFAGSRFFFTFHVPCPWKCLSFIFSPETETFLLLKYPGRRHCFKWMKANCGWMSGRWRESDRCWLKSPRWLCSPSAPAWKWGSVPWIQMAARALPQTSANTRLSAAACCLPTLMSQPSAFVPSTLQRTFHGTCPPPPAWSSTNTGFFIET